MDVLRALEDKCKGASGPDAVVEVEVRVLQAAAEGLQEIPHLQKQLDAAQEQLTLKPSVAKKLAARIRALEGELEEVRDASKVVELEKKVAKLEGELKQSYATKNFTLKSGLLEIEKKYRASIYGHEELEELWGEVLQLLMDDNKEAVHLTTPSAIIQKAKLARQATGTSHSSRTSSIGGGLAAMVAMAAAGTEGAAGSESQSVARTVEKLEEQAADSGPLLPRDPAAPHRPHQDPSASSTSELTLTVDARYEAPEKGVVPSNNAFLVAATPVATTEAGITLGSATTTTTTPAVTPMAVTAATTAPHPARIQGTPKGGMGVQAGTVHRLVDVSSMQATQDALFASIDALRALFEAGGGGPVFPAGLEGGGGPAPQGGNDGVNMVGADAQAGLLSLRTSMQALMDLWTRLGGGAGGVGADVQGGLSLSLSPRVADASYFDQQAEAVLGSIEALRQAFSARRQQLQGQGRGSGGEVADEAGDAFAAQADSLAAAVLEMRAQLGAQVSQAQQRMQGYRGSPARPPLPHAPRSLHQQALQQQAQQQQALQQQQQLALFLSFLAKQGLLKGTPDASNLAAVPTSPSLLVHQNAAFDLPAGSRSQVEVAVVGDEVCFVEQGTPVRGAGWSATSLPPVDELMREFQEFSAQFAASGAAEQTDAGVDDATAPAVAATPIATAAAAAASANPALGAVASMPSTPVHPSRSAVHLESSMQRLKLLHTAPEWWPRALAAATTAGNKAVEDQAAAPPTTTDVGQGGEVVVVDLQRVSAASGGAASVTSGIVTPSRHTRKPSSGTAQVHAHGMLMLPGPARTMQAVAAHVRTKHAEFLAANPEAEVLLREALEASAELQAAQDGALLAAAMTGTRTPGTSPGPGPIPLLTARRLATSASMAGLVRSPSLLPSAPTAKAASARGGAGSDHGVEAEGEGDSSSAETEGAEVSMGGAWVVGAPTGAAEATVALALDGDGEEGEGAGGYAGQRQEVPPQGDEQGECAEEQGKEEGREHGEGEEARDKGVQDEGALERGDEGDFEDEDDLTRLTADDYAQEMDELRSIAAAHAESAAALQELVAKLAEEHADAVTRADDLESRVGQQAQQCDELQVECEALTRALVDVKLLYAERDHECMRMEQRLRRALSGQGAALEEVEEMRQRLAVVAPDQVHVANRTQFKQAMRTAQKAADADLAAATGAAPANHTPGDGVSGSTGDSTANGTPLPAMGERAEAAGQDAQLPKLVSAGSGPGSVGGRGLGGVALPPKPRRSGGGSRKSEEQCDIGGSS